jgi:hypothetical protein
MALCEPLKLSNFKLKWIRIQIFNLTRILIGIQPPKYVPTGIHAEVVGSGIFFPKGVGGFSVIEFTVYSEKIPRRWWTDLTASATTSPVIVTTGSSALGQTTESASAVSPNLHLFIFILLILLQDERSRWMRCNAYI